MRTSLRPELVADTADVLSRRIRERFPGSGLWDISVDLAVFARGAEELSVSLGKPMWGLRAASLVVAVAVAAAAAFGISLVPVRKDLGGISDFVQGVQSLLQCIVYLAAAIWFVASLEARMKRSRVLRELRRLRSLAHVIDMHQLAKDPSYAVSVSVPTKSSPRRDITGNDLSRYLEYCSEMLAIVAKLAAVYIQRVPDSVCLEVASDIEKLCLGLSQKIWQKLTMSVGSVALWPTTASEERPPSP